MPDKAAFMSADGAALCSLQRGNRYIKPLLKQRMVFMSNKPFLLFMVRLMQISTHVLSSKHIVVNKKEVNVPSKNLY